MAIARNIALTVFCAMMAVLATGERSWALLAIAATSGAVVVFTSGAHVIFTRGLWFDTEVDEWCSDIDTVVDMQDAHDARMRREARV